MPEISIVEVFGDFKFAPSLHSTPNPKPIPIVSAPAARGGGGDGNDDEWGDFLQSPIQSDTTFDFFDPPLSRSASATLVQNPSRSGSGYGSGSDKQWQKPQGAIPLSIFGEEEPDADDGPDLALGSQNGFPPKPDAHGPTNGLKLGLSAGGLNDLIMNLYGPPASDRGVVSAGGSTGDLNGRVYEFSRLEAKGSSVKNENEKEGDFDDALRITASLSDSDIQDGSGNGVIMENKSNSNSISRDVFLNENGGEFTDDFPEAGVFNYSHDRKVGLGNGLTVGSGSNPNFFFANIDLDMDDWVFEDTFPEPASQNKKELGVADVLGAKPKDLIFGSEIQVGVGNGVAKDHGPNISIDANTGLGANSQGFEDAFTESGTRHNSSQHHEELGGADLVGPETRGLAFSNETQGLQLLSLNQQRTQPPLISSNDKQDAGDIFCAQDGFQYKPMSFVRSGTNASTLGSVVPFDELMSSLYSQAEHTSSVNSAQGPFENGRSPDQLGLNPERENYDDDWDENDWEFKDAFSDARNEDVGSNLKVGPQKEFPTDLGLHSILGFYSRLKEESCILTLHHLDCLKKANKVAAMSDEKEVVASLDEKIQATYAKLQEENMISENLDKEHPQRSCRVHELLEVMQDSKFQAFELEYKLSRRISAAEDELSSAVGLLEHATSVLHVMSLASEEEQSSYVTMWLKMVSACAQELQHGALIWKQSLQNNIQLQILSETEGLRYFLSLGEIYRVVEVLRSSLTLYKPWVLSNRGDSMSTFVQLDECKSAWMSCGLKEALEIIPDSVDHEYKGISKALLESINATQDLNEVALHNLVFGESEPSLCRLSLLSSQVSHDMKVIIWNGKHYFLKLANFWANRFSSDPPELPDILVH